MPLLVSRRTAAVCLVAGPLLFAISDLVRRTVDPHNEADPVAALRLVRAHEGSWALAGALAIASAFVLLAGLGAILSLAPRRGRVLTHIGVLVLGAGSIASVAHATGEFGQPAVRAGAGVSEAVATAMDQSGYWPWDIAVLVFIAGFLVGPVLVMVGLRRARAVPVWAVVATLVAGACGGSAGVPAGIVGVVAWLAAFVPVSLALVRGQVPESRPGAIGAADPAQDLHELRTGAV